MHAKLDGIVALLAEGVDRNKVMGYEIQRPGESPSSRRAWIEILFSALSRAADVVALLAEGVDRNNHAALVTLLLEVALLAEGVDRNWYGCSLAVGKL